MPEAVRELQPGEFDTLCLPLRYAILKEELGWAPKADSPDSFRDRFDDCSIHFGFFIDQALIGILRVTIADAVQALPCSRHVPSSHLLTLRAAEFSRASVDKSFRGRFVYPRLLRTGISRAI